MFVFARQLILAAVLLVVGANTQADECALPRETVAERPDRDVPTRVRIGLFVVDVTGIDDVEQTFTADLYLSISWRDPRLAASSESDAAASCRYRLEDVWHPQLAFLYQRGLGKSSDAVVEIDAAGEVLYQQRFSGALSAPVDLREFPFDQQSLPLRLVSARYGPDEIELVVDEERSGRLERFSIAGWTIGATALRWSGTLLTVKDRQRVGIAADLPAQRHSGFFVLRVLLPLSLIVFMAWTVFWIDPREFGPQSGVATASVLTLIAFQLSLGHLLPRVSYLTRIDRFLLGASLLVFLALGEAILTSRLAKGERADLARRIDGWARWGYPALFGLVVVVALWL